MIVLRDGAIAATGSIDELRARTNVHTLEDAFSVLTESEDASRKTARLLDAFAHIST
jgi:ABC-type Na+ transport system ATPase subunit NatA